MKFEKPWHLSYIFILMMTPLLPECIYIWPYILYIADWFSSDNGRVGSFPHRQQEAPLKRGQLDFVKEGTVFFNIIVQPQKVRIYSRNFAQAHYYNAIVTLLSGVFSEAYLLYKIYSFKPQEDRLCELMYIKYLSNRSIISHPYRPKTTT